MATCYKIIQIQRYNYRDSFQYYFFPNKLVVLPSTYAKKITEYQCANQEAVEKKYAAIEKRKLKIGYEVVNHLKNPRCFNLFMKHLKSFLSLMEKEPKIYFNRIGNQVKEDSDGDFFIHRSPLEKKAFVEEFAPSSEIIDLFTPLRHFQFQIEVRGDLFYKYRIAIVLFPEYSVLWSNTEPVNKLDCPLAKSIITQIEQEENFNLSEAPNRIQVFSKGLFALIDLKTGKIYNAADWMPKYDAPIDASDIESHKSIEHYCTYFWERLEHDVGYSLANA